MVSGREPRCNRGMTSSVVSTVLPSVRTLVRRTALRVALVRQGGAPDVSTLERVPEASRFPFRRDGVDPVPALAASRAAAPVTRLTRVLGLDVWLVTGDPEARRVLAGHAAFSNDLRHLLGPRPRAGADQVGGLGMTDDPDHARLRRVLTPWFTRRRLAGLQPAIDAVVAQSLDDLAAHGPVVDLVERFGFRVPFQVICDLLGMPEVDRAEFRRLGAARFDLSHGGVGSFGAAADSREFLIDLVARQRRHPERCRGGLVHDILAAHGDELDDVEIGGLADGVFLGGYETSAAMLALGTYVLTRDRTAYGLLRTGSAADADRVVDELLRYVCPVQTAFPRFARHDVDLGGVRVRAGDVVLVSLTGANRDPAEHPAADAFDPTAGGAAHLAFGHGLHRCVGAELARMELRTALCGLATRFPGLGLAVEPGELRFTELSVVYGVEALPVRLG